MIDSFSLTLLLAAIGILLLCHGRKTRRKLPRFIGVILTFAALLLVVATVLLATAARNH